MEKGNSTTESGSSGSWWLDNNRLHQSQWLQSTLSDLEKKVKSILSLVEDDGDTFAKRADMFYRNRPLLIESIEDLHGSYKSLADKYDQLVMGSRNVYVLPKMGLPIPKNPNQVSPELRGTDHDQDSDSEYEEWQSIDKDQVAKGWQLIQDNLEQQAKLIKLNDEKREAINELHARINKLVAENTELKTKLAHMKVDINQNRSQLSKAKDAILKRIMPESRNES